MTNEEAQDAAEKAGRNAKQVKNNAKAAAKNSGKALRSVAEDAAENVVEEAQETADKVEGTLHDASRTAKRINDSGVLRLVSADVALLGFELAIATYAGVHAYGRYRKIKGTVNGYAAGRATID